MAESLAHTAKRSFPARALRVVKPCSSPVTRRISPAAQGSSRAGRILGNQVSMAAVARGTYARGTGKSAAVQRRNPRRRLSGSRAIRARESPDQTSNWTLIARQGRSTISIPNPGQAWRKVPGSTTACL